MKWELENFNEGIKKGLPADERQVDAYLQRMSKHNTALIAWLEDFKQKFGTCEDESARSAIRDVEDALARFKSKIGAIMVKVGIAKARDARAKDGSPLVLLFTNFVW